MDIQQELCKALWWFFIRPNFRRAIHRHALHTTPLSETRCLSTTLVSFPYLRLEGGGGIHVTDSAWNLLQSSADLVKILFFQTPLIPLQPLINDQSLSRFLG